MSARDDGVCPKDEMQHPTWNPTYDPTPQAPSGDAVLSPATWPLASTDPVAPWVADQLDRHGWHQAQHLQPAIPTPAPMSMPAPGVLEDPLSWRLVKHASTLGIVAIAIAIAAGGASGEPVLLLGWAVTVLLLVATTAVADRIRFHDAVRHHAAACEAASAAASMAAVETVAARRFSIDVS